MSLGIVAAGVAVGCPAVAFGRNPLLPNKGPSLMNGPGRMSYVFCMKVL